MRVPTGLAAAAQAATSHTIKSRIRSPLAFAVACAMGLVVAPSDSALAQNAGASARAGEDDLANVTVTARRREERSQDVPLAIAVLSSDSLESTGTFTIGRLQQLQPSIQFYSSNPRNSATNIRGLGAPFGLTNDGIEQGVGFYVDQVYYARAASATFDFLDVERVEVLRGPQGTLYGKNTTAGAISVTSRKPSFEWDGRAEVTGGNLDFIQAKGSISGPLVAEKLAFRLGASYTDRRGTTFNTRYDDYINELGNVGVKGQLLLRATDSLNVTLFGDYSRQNPLGYAQYYVREGSTQRPLNRQYASLAAASGNYAPPSFDPFDRVTDIDSELSSKNTLGGASLLAEWNVGPGQLTSVTAWRSWRWGPKNDRDFIGLPITTKSENPQRQDQWTQEVRFAGTSGKLDYVAGAYGFYQEIATSGLQEQGPLASRWLLSGAQANDPSILNGLRSENDIALKNTSAALFGQVTWHVTDKLSLQPGLRFNYDKKDGRYVATVTNATNTPLTAAQRGVLAPQSYAPEFSDTNVSGDFTASYQFATDLLGYATFARSFKSGGINLAGLPLDANNNPITAVETIKPEKVNHYELGFKTQLLDRRITANFALFRTDIDDYQANVTNLQANVLRGYLANAEEVRVQGVEAELAFSPTDNLNLYVNGAYTDAEYVSFPDAPCPPELSGGTAANASNPPSAPGTPGGFSPPFCDISGQWLPGISKVSVAYGLQYELPTQLFGQAGGAYFGVDGSYRSKFSSNPSRSAYTDIGAYGLVAFRAGFRTDSGWDVSGWVRNAFDREYFEILAVQSGSTGLVIGQPGDPRTYGVTARFSF